MKNLSLEKSTFYKLNSSLQCSIAKKIALDFNKIILELIKKNQTVNILEIGAGSGNLTLTLLKNLYQIAKKNQNCNFNFLITEPNHNFFEMIQKEIETWNIFLEQSETKNIKLNLRKTDFEFFFNKDFKEKFDITLSNFVYHWIEDFNSLFKSFHSFSKYHIFSIPINKSFNNIKNKLHQNNIDFKFENNLPQAKNITYLMKEVKNTTSQIKIKQHKIIKKFVNIFSILKFFSKSGYATKKNITANQISTLKKIKSLQDSCKMDFIYLKIISKI